MLAVSEEDWKNQKLDLSGEFEVGFHFLEAISRNQNQNGTNAGGFWLLHITLFTQ